MDTVGPRTRIANMTASLFAERERQGAKGSHSTQWLLHPHAMTTLDILQVAHQGIHTSHLRRGVCCPVMPHSHGKQPWAWAQDTPCVAAWSASKEEVGQSCLIPCDESTPMTIAMFSSFKSPLPCSSPQVKFFIAIGVLREPQLLPLASYPPPPVLTPPYHFRL